MRSSGIVSLMARLLKSSHIDIVVPIMGILSNCAAQVSIIVHNQNNTLTLINLMSVLKFLRVTTNLPLQLKE